MVQLLQDVYRTVASLQDNSRLCVASDGCEFASQEALFCHVFDCSQDQAECPVPQSDLHQEEAMCLPRHIRRHLRTVQNSETLLQGFTDMSVRFSCNLYFRFFCVKT